MYFGNWFKSLCYSLYFLLSSAYLNDIMIEFKGNKHSCLYTAYAKLQWVNTFMSMKHIHVKVYIKYIKIGGGGGANAFWKVLSLSELIYCMKGRRRETNLTRDVFSLRGPLPSVSYLRPRGWCYCCWGCLWRPLLCPPPPQTCSGPLCGAVLSKWGQLG